MFAGVDVGRYETKVSLVSTVKSFPSRVGEARTLKVDNHQTREWDVEIDGLGHFFVGSLAEESYTRREMTTASKLHLETKVLFLTALAVAHVTEGLIVTGVPVSQHDEATKTALRQLLEGQFKVTLNGELSTITVKDLQVVPEGTGAFWHQTMSDTGIINREKLIQLPRVRVIDIGSRTVNYVTLAEGIYLDRESGTLPYGCLELNNMDPGQEDSFARRIVGDLSKRLADMDLTQDQFLLSGGGVGILGNSLREFFQRVEIIDQPSFANAIGYRKLGVAYDRQNGKARVIRQ